MIYKINDLVKVLREKDVPVSRSSLLRWEKQGKIPKLYRSLGGWRYVDEKLLEELLKILK